MVLRHLLRLPRGGRALSTNLWCQGSRICSDVTEAIGKTPLVRLNRVMGSACQAKQVLAKLEMQNPGGSVKDRISKAMIERAEARGLIHPSRTTVVEATSGNTGIGLAMVCAAKGYRCIIIMPQLPPMLERYIICRKFGAHVHLTAGAVGAPMVQNMFAHLTDLLEKNPEYWCPRQFENDDNPAVHFETTGPEVWEQTGGEVDFFVAGAGTGATIAGAGKFLQQKNANIINVCVEPEESRVLAGKSADKHSVVGIGAGIELKFIEELAPGKPFTDGPRGPINRFMSASSDEAILWANRLAVEEGLLVGPSTGAACKVACEIACTDEAKGKTIVVIFPSAGIRYVAHPMWAAAKEEAAAILAPPADLSNAPPMMRWKSEAYMPPQT
ncbi:hypothetical protein AB1Y20_000047 [Prymnesium parvum]|uniref:Tryptophan synthase beta chain-like PALP domain-containing protein n=1 Tax=Prymnesium parvum TaxID=97485 RepID=A0AB34K4B0_PRYPA